MSAKTIFFSYSKHDRTFLEELLVFLSPMKRSGKIIPWDDAQIIAGEEWDNAIKTNLESADIIIMLVSARFLATDYIWREEISKAMARHEAGTARVIPIILNYCDWSDTPFRKLQALPGKSSYVADAPNRDKVWTDIVNAIKRSLDAPLKGAETEAPVGNTPANQGVQATPETPTNAVTPLVDVAEIKKMVAEGNLKKAIAELLNRSAQSDDNDFQNQVTMFSARFNKLEKDNMMGMVASADYNMGINRISFALLDLLDRL